MRIGGSFSCVAAIVLGSYASMAAGQDPLGLVLSGGGAKGAYEVGVWQTLIETGVSKRVAAISGTSVGAINAALFAAVVEPERCAALWEDEIGDIFRFNTNLVVKLHGEDGRLMVERAYAAMRRNIQEDCEVEAKRRSCDIGDLPEDVVASINKTCESVARKRLFIQMDKLKAFSEMLTDFDESKPIEGFLPMSTLHSLIMRELPAKWPRKAPATYATAVCKEGDDFSMARFHLLKCAPDKRASMICASACIPFIFGMLEIDSKTYVDGGYESKGGDNVPIGPILENHPGIRTVIVVYLDDEKHLKKERRERVNKAAVAAGIRLVEIIPSENIGGSFGGLEGVFDSSPETAKRLIALGRKDAERVLKEEGLSQ